MSVDRMHKVTLVVYYTHYVLVTKYGVILHVVFKMNYISLRYIFIFILFLIVVSVSFTGNAESPIM